jgi:hypothetical protein
MKKREANKLLAKASYLLGRTVALKNPNSQPPLQEEQYLVTSFGAAKVYVSNNEYNYWYELWANLKNIKTGTIHKMFISKMILAVSEKSLTTNDKFLKENK